MSHILVSLLPVFMFLVALYFLDSYKLIRLRSILVTIVVGCFIALVALFVNSSIIAGKVVALPLFMKYGAPTIEELLKAAYIIYLVKSNQIGFMVDAALYGFALGAGFAFTENLYYLYSLQESNLLLWLIRGLGTAMMHGGTTAMFGVISHTFSERYSYRGIMVFLPGAFIAIVFHTVYNHFILNPVISTILIIIIFPASMLFIFKRSEAATRKWLGPGLDSDLEVLDLILTGDLSDSNIGRYLSTLVSHFPREVVGDMLCMIRIYTELGMRAKGILMMRESGFAGGADEETIDKLNELKYLEQNIGQTGRLAIAPMLHRSSRSIWQLQLLKKE